MSINEFIQDHVRRDYGKIALEQQSDSIINESVSSEEMSSSVGYTEEELAMAPEGANLALGCIRPGKRRGT